jgi:hypothetical protein
MNHGLLFMHSNSNKFGSVLGKILKKYFVFCHITRIQNSVTVSL